MANTVHRFLESELPESARKDALFHVIACPYEATVSYGKGTAQGPEKILEASDQLELWDGIGEWPLEKDGGIFTCPPIDCTDREKMATQLQNEVAATLDMEKIPFILGGEHSITPLALRAVRDYFGTGEVGIVQFDAHADLRDSYEDDPNSHACAMRRSVEMGFKLYQIGNRAFCKNEAHIRELFKIPHLDGDPVNNTALEALSLPLDFPRLLYITFDIDGLDSTVMPATGTPVPGGLRYEQALLALQRVMKGRRVIGMDCVEFAPIPSFHAYDFLATSLVYKMMTYAYRNNKVFCK